MFDIAAAVVTQGENAQSDNLQDAKNAKRVDPASHQTAAMDHSTARRRLRSTSALFHHTKRCHQLNEIGLSPEA